MIIDETTGLPQLEEGLVWRVGDRSCNPHEYTNQSDVMWVEICRTYTKTVSESVEKMEKRSVRNFWRPLRMIRESVDVEKEMVSAVQSRMLADYLFTDLGAPYPEDGWKTDRRVWCHDKEDVQQRFYRPLPPTPDSVLNVATAVYEKYVARIKREKEKNDERVVEQAARESISGIYPPKKLGGSK